uniref:Uncharacterized protein n=1 Tax=Leersia perrieri TaxID=77586 RepID=A0A0D9XD75_9ORYZ
MDRITSYGSVSPPRCGHSATIVKERLFLFGGSAGAGPVMGNLWALKGVMEEGHQAVRYFGFSSYDALAFRITLMMLSVGMH